VNVDRPRDVAEPGFYRWVEGGGRDYESGVGHGVALLRPRYEYAVALYEGRSIGPLGL